MKNAKREGLLHRIDHPSDKQNGTGLPVADEEEEWAVHGHLHAGEREGGHPSDDRCRGGGLGAGIAHRDQRFVKDRVDVEVTGAIHPRKVGLVGLGGGAFESTLTSRARSRPSRGANLIRIPGPEGPMGQPIPRRSDPTALTDAEGERIAPYLPPRRSPRGRRRAHAEREILKAI